MEGQYVVTNIITEILNLHLIHEKLHLFDNLVLLVFSLLFFIAIGINPLYYEAFIFNFNVTFYLNYNEFIFLPVIEMIRDTPLLS